MTSEEYLNQLQKYLKKLPPRDYKDAMEYFTEYFEEAGEEHAQDVIEELGAPRQAAGELVRNLLDKKIDEQEGKQKEEKKREKGSHVIWIAILALLAAPVGAPILASLVIVLLCAALCVAIFDLCIFILAASGVVVGVKLLIRGILAVSVSFSGFAMISGMGIFLLGAGILCVVLGIYFCKWMVWLFLWLTRKLTRRGGKRA